MDILDRICLKFEYQGTWQNLPGNGETSADARGLVTGPLNGPEATFLLAPLVAPEACGGLRCDLELSWDPLRIRTQRAAKISPIALPNFSDLEFSSRVNFSGSRLAVFGRATPAAARHSILDFDSFSNSL